MLRQTDIPPAQVGEPLSKGFLDLLIRGANSGRVQAGDGSIGANVIGSRSGYSDLSIGQRNDGAVLIQVDSQNVSGLNDGLYRCRVYMQPFICFNHMAGAAQFNDDPNATSSGQGPAPYPNAALCYVFNMAEFGQSGHAIMDDITIYAWPLGYSDDGVQVLGIPSGASTGVFPVRLFKDGGVAGSNTTTCNLTYTCKSLSNQPLSNGSSNTTTLATPKGNVRLANVTYATPANGTYGEAFYDNSSPPVLVLAWAFDEKPSQTQCP